MPELRHTPGAKPELRYTPREKERLKAKRLKRMKPSARNEPIDRGRELTGIGTRGHANRYPYSNPPRGNPKEILAMRKQNKAKAIAELEALQRALDEGRVSPREIQAGGMAERVKKLRQIVNEPDPTPRERPRGYRPYNPDSPDDPPYEVHGATGIPAAYPHTPQDVGPPSRPRGKR